MLQSALSTAALLALVALLLLAASERALAKATRSPKELNRDAITMAQRGDLHGSLELFRELLQADPGNSQWWNNAGVTLMRLRLYHLSVVHLRQALEIDGNPDAAANVGLLGELRG